MAQPSRTPRVELLWWDGCPSAKPALEQARDALRELGLDESEVVMREIRDDDEAQAVGFVGSPTVLVDGVDVAPPPNDEPVRLACRVYHRRDGRISPVPDPDDLREALLAASSRAE